MCKQSFQSFTSVFHICMSVHASLFFPEHTPTHTLVSTRAETACTYLVWWHRRRGARGMTPKSSTCTLDIWCRVMKYNVSEGCGITITACGCLSALEATNSLSHCWLSDDALFTQCNVGVCVSMCVCVKGVVTGVDFSWEVIAEWTKDGPRCQAAVDFLSQTCLSGTARGWLSIPKTYMF